MDEEPFDLAAACEPVELTPISVQRFRLTPAVPPGDEELREALIEALDLELDSLGISGEVSARASDYLADAILALPAVRDALAAQETLRRVEALLRDADRFPEGHALNRISADNLRRALDGSP